MRIFKFFFICIIFIYVFIFLINAELARNMEKYTKYSAFYEIWHTKQFSTFSNHVFEGDETNL